MCADIYRKGFTDSGKWEAACELINIVDPSKLKRLLRARNEERKEDATLQGQGAKTSVPGSGSTSGVQGARKAMNTDYWKVQQEKVSAAYGGAPGVTCCLTDTQSRQATSPIPLLQSGGYLRMQRPLQCIGRTLEFTRCLSPPSIA